ncbi:MAG: AlwI family type II restriction endonuclease [Nitrospirae bacterium]|nr:AlwI family type II restriction endonuclease [Nitrospirota bacterium]
MRPWYLGNTTVRSPFRLRDGLIALANSPLGGRIKGRENEIAFAWVLHNSGVVNIVRPDANVSDLGRKWRAALSQLGFIYPEVPAREGIPQNEIGEPFTITPNGRRLIDADNVPGMQECFLRSLAAYYIPSALERGYTFRVFSPLRHTLALMMDLERHTGDTTLNFLEMGLYVQMTSSDNPLNEVVSSILAFRSDRMHSTNKRRFDQTALNAAAGEHKYVAGTFKDYADTNLRYLKATGLVQSKGRGISVVAEKKVFVEQLLADTSIPDSDRSILITICKGAALPTDNRDAAIVVLNDLVSQINRRGISYTIADRPVHTPADIAVLRHEIEHTLAELNEDEYAERQAQEWIEILQYMDLLINPRCRPVRGNDDSITIPQTEAPAYFEWILWRAFLAIDSLVNKPYTARRFKIDHEFLPVGTAPGNGPDLIFEFEDFVVVVEVTLTESSRQEAAEGEPVRRHVAELAIQYDKPVYGMFLANRIDSNTAETFRIGVWYTRDDTRMRLDIIPFTLAQFKAFFEAMFTSRNVRVAAIRDLLDTCSTLRQDLHAPEWKTKIAQAVQAKASALMEM